MNEKSSIFVSYKRRTEPDETLACTIASYFRNRGHDTFLDTDIAVGDAWARRIESTIRSSDFVIVLLTHPAISSEMIRGEIEIARNQADTAAGKPTIVPVRAAFVADLPYPLNSYLGGLQYALWRGDSDTEPLLKDLTAVVEGVLPARLLDTVSPLPVSSRDQPLYSQPLPPPGGNVDLDDP